MQRTGHRIIERMQNESVGVSRDERVAICQQVDFLGYLNGHGLVVSANGPGKFIAKSPFRDERTPSFAIYAPGIGRMGHRGWTWCDYGDNNRNGDAIALVIELTACSLPEAANALKTYCGHGRLQSFDSQKVNPRVQNAEIVQLAPAYQQSAYGTLFSTVRAHLPTAYDDGCRYLKNRGISSPAIALMGGAYRIPTAQASDAIARQLTTDADTFSQSAQAGICYDTRAYPHLSPRLYWRDDTVLLPCLVRNGERATYAVGRRMQWEPGDEMGKYVMGSCAHGAYRAPYGLPSLRVAAQQRETLIICEGATDALAAETLGFHAIAMLGRPHAINDEDNQSSCARQLSYVLDDLQRCRDVLVLRDNDVSAVSQAVGKKGADNLASWLRTRGMRSTSITMDDLGYGSFKDLAAVTESQLQTE